MSNNDIPVKEIGEMLDMVSDKLPNLIKDIYGILYSQEGATSMGQAVGTFYKHLVDAGMDKDDAMRLTRDYMSTLNSMASQFKS